MKPSITIEHTRPDFTGVWEVNFARSVMRGPAPKQILIKIEHREPMLIQQILYTNSDGTEQQMTFKYETGAETANSIGGATASMRARWEGTELVIESKMKMLDHEVYFKDHWSLSDNGRTLTMAHRDDDLAGLISVLEKAFQAEATRFDKLTF